MAIPCDAAIASYLDHLRIERGLSVNSVESYKRDLYKFQNLLSENSLSYEQLKEVDLSSIIGELIAGGLAPTSVNRFFSALKGFYKYCAMEYSIANPTLDISQFKIARFLEGYFHLQIN